LEFPEENELVIIVIKKIMPYGAFCSLPEYENLEAFLHISEIAPRWIKNIHEFVSEGQRTVAKVHHIDKQKNQVDVSLKRTSDEEKRRKLEQVNFEKRAERLIEVALSSMKGKKPDAEEVKEKIREEYGDLYSCLKEVSEKGAGPLEEFKFPKALQNELVEIAQKNIKKQMVILSGTIKLICHGGDGAALIKDALIEISKGKETKVTYLGAPRYKLSITDSDYKSGEKKLSQKLELLEDFAKKHSCNFEFMREDE